MTAPTPAEVLEQEAGNITSYLPRTYDRETFKKAIIGAAHSYFDAEAKALLVFGVDHSCSQCPVNTKKYAAHVLDEWRKQGGSMMLLKHREDTKMSDEAIVKFVNDLFTNVRGEKADRLVMFDADERDLGGWSRQAVIDRLRKAVKQGGSK